MRGNASGLVHDRQQTGVGGGADDDRYDGFCHRWGVVRARGVAGQRVKPDRAALTPGGRARRVVPPWR